MNMIGEMERRMHNVSSARVSPWPGSTARSWPAPPAARFGLSDTTQCSKQYTPRLRAMTVRSGQPASSQPNILGSG